MTNNFDPDAEYLEKVRQVMAAQEAEHHAAVQRRAASDVNYTNDGNGHTVRIGGRAIGRVRKSGMYWHAYTMTGQNVRGTFMSMSAAGQRLVERDQERTV